ncbi:uncharacterized protein ACO6RY_07830 [Pungitius sinensis]
MCSDLASYQRRKDFSWKKNGCVTKVHLFPCFRFSPWTFMKAMGTQSRALAHILASKSQLGLLGESGDSGRLPSSLHPKIPRPKVSISMSPSQGLHLKVSISRSLSQGLHLKVSIAPSKGHYLKVSISLGLHPKVTISWFPSR